MSRSQHVSLEGAHVHETSLCVAPGAPRLGSKFCSQSQCSTYVTFSITFGAPVLQYTICVTFFARRRAVPPSLLGGGLATQAAQAGPDIRHVRPPFGFRSLRSPQSAPTHASKPHHGHFDSTGVVSSVAGCAMHMKWPDGIGRGNWDWEDPAQESANEKSGIARTDRPCCWVSPPRMKRACAHPNQF